MYCWPNPFVALCKVLGTWGRDLVSPSDRPSRTRIWWCASTLLWTAMPWSAADPASRARIHRHWRMPAPAALMPCAPARPENTSLEHEVEYRTWSPRTTMTRPPLGRSWFPIEPKVGIATTIFKSELHSEVHSLRFYETSLPYHLIEDDRRLSPRSSWVCWWHFSYCC